ncbi:MAG: IMP dehydrogenase [Bacteroidales bacterium]|nr:IMP dehydrogenase [Bacteroidales bacterium]
MSFITDRIAFEGLTFDDVLLIPSYSEVIPRDVDTSTRFSRNVSLDIPIVSAAMDTVTEAPMAEAVAAQGGIGVIHKNMSIEAQAANVKAVKAKGRKVAAGIGINASAMERVEALVESGVDAIVLDCAHGHSRNVGTLLKEVKKAFPALDVVVGNIATADAAKYLIDNGADGLKVGIGPGSICTTRVVAGVGVPQLSAIYDVSLAASGTGVPVIADGGLRYSGDMVKALAAGAHCVMCGSMFAGTLEAPGEVITIDGLQYKTYRGMGSIDAMNAGSADRYFQDNCKKLVPEGVVARVAYKGKVEDVIFQMLGGIRSGMGYCGAHNIEELHGARFTRITSNGVVENHPHDVTIAKKAPNYNK